MLTEKFIIKVKMKFLQIYSLSVIAPCRILLKRSIHHKQRHKEIPGLVSFHGMSFTFRVHTVIKRPCYPRDTVILCVSPFVRASCESGSEFSSWPPHQLWQDVPHNEESWCACTCVTLSLRGCPPFLSESKRACVLQLRLYPPTSTSACLCDLLQPSASLSLVTPTSLTCFIAPT